MATMSVKVAVRVRPFLPREVERKAKCCVNMVRSRLKSERRLHFHHSSWDRGWPHFHIRLLLLEPRWVLNQRGRSLCQNWLQIRRPTVRLLSRKRLVILSSESRSWIMPGTDTIAVCLLTARQAQASPTRWWATAPTRASFRLHVTRFSKESKTRRTPTWNTK